MERSMGFAGVLRPVAVILFMVVFPFEDTGATPALLYSEATRELTAAVSSEYNHTTYVDEVSGTFNYDCSGFVGYALKRLSVPAWNDIPRGSRSRPLAENFANHFVTLTDTSTGYWSSPLVVSALMPGDVIAWLRPPESTTTNTGHVMIVGSLPRLDADRPGQYVIKVIDSSESVHTNDTRTVGDDGLGSGWIALIVNGSSNGAPVGYKWRGGISDCQSSVRLTTVGLGRVNILPTSAPSSRPSVAPSWRPSKAPSPAPSRRPSKQPTPVPSFKPSKAPSPKPSTRPTKMPTSSPTLKIARLNQDQHQGEGSQKLQRSDDAVSKAESGDKNVWWRWFW